MGFLFFIIGVYSLGMQIKNIIISTIIGLAVIGGAFYAVFGSTLKNLSTDTTVPPTESASTTATTTPKKTSTGTKETAPAPVPSGYAMTEVQKHNSATSCWSAINGSVYDLTNWVDSHPGGKAAILMICGKDGSPLFNAQHGGSNRVASVLAKFKIGALN